MEYRIRLRDFDSNISIIDVSFSQLCKYLPPRHRNEIQRLKEQNFFRGISSIDGPMGNVKLITK